MAADRRHRPKTIGRRPVAGWRANAIDLHLSADDLGLLDNVLTVIPILRIVVVIGQEARKRNLTYPISGIEELQKCLGSDPLVFDRHRIDRDAIAHTMPKTWFPIVHEGELLSRVHLALLRCKLEAEQLAPRPALHNP